MIRLKCQASALLGRKDTVHVCSSTGFIPGSYVKIDSDGGDLVSKGKAGRSSFYLPGLFFLSGTALGLQISITRLLTISIGQSLAYLVVSLALLGYGAAALLLQLLGQKDQARQNLLLGGSLAFALFIPGSFYLLAYLACDPWQLIWDKRQLPCLLLMLICLFLPFFFAGLAVASCYLEKNSRLGRLYFADLAGAGSGCLWALFLFEQGWDERILWLLAASAVLALLFFCLAWARQRLLKGLPLLALALLLLLAWTGPLRLNISPLSELRQALDHTDASTTKTSWDSSGRLDLVKSPAVRFAPGLSLAYNQPLPDQLGLSFNAGQLQALTALEEGKMGFLSALPSALPYHLQVPEKVFINGFAGGQDILAAFWHEAGAVRASEANQAIVAAWQDYYVESAIVAEWLLSGRLEILPLAGRRFLERPDQLYDLIVLPLVQTGPAGPGLFQSGEDYRFTEEAFATYYTALAENGYLAVSRYLEPIPAEALRLPLTLQQIWPRAGDSLLAIRSWSTYTILAKKGSFNEDELAGLRSFCAKNSFDLVYYPGIVKEEANRHNRYAEPIYYQLWQDLLADESRAELTEKYMLAVNPVTDDAPFYNNYFSWQRLGSIRQASSGNWRFLLQGGLLPPLLLIVLLVLAVCFLFLPLLFKKKRSRIRRSSLLLLFYFLCIGAAFIFFEVNLISRMAILFDSPIQAMGLVLTALLLSSGLASLLLDRILTRPDRRLAFLLLLPAGLLLAYAGLLPALLSLLLPLADFWRFALGGLSLVPAGLGLGLPFVLGLAFLRQQDEAALPWALALNSLASVAGAPLALLLASSWGQQKTTALAGSGYLLAALFLWLGLYCRAWPVMGTKETSAS